MSECTNELPHIEVRLLGSDHFLTLPPDSGGDGYGTWWQTLVLPAFGFRTTLAAPSVWVPGQQLLSVVADAATINLTLAVRGHSTAECETLKAEVEAAFAQFSYALVVAVQDAGDPAPAEVLMGPWRGFPALPSWGPITPQRQSLYAAEGAIAAQLNPTGAP